MTTILDLSWSMMICSIWCIAAFGVQLEVIPTRWVGFAEQVFFYLRFLAIGCTHLCHNTAIWDKKEVMLYKIYSICSTVRLTQASGDILEDPTELIRLKNSNSSAAVAKENQLEAKSK